MEFTYIGDRVSAGGGCVAAVTVRTRCGWVKFRECSDLLYGRRFPLRLKGLFIGVMLGQQCCMRVKHVPERKCACNFTMDRKIHGENNLWSTAQR